MKDTGMGTEDVVLPRYGDIRKKFEAGETFIHVPALRQKTMTHYDTFIEPDAVEALKTYFAIRRRAGEVFTDKTALFLSEGTGMIGEPLKDVSIRTAFRRLRRKIGIVVSPHRVGKLFDSYMALKVRSPVVLKYWMGHSVESSDIEERYVLPPLAEQKKLYMEAYSQIDISPKVTVSKEELRGVFIDAMTDEQLEPFARQAHMSAPEYRRIFRLGKMKTPKTKECKDGDHCQKIVAENELPKLLASGWRFIATLPSGKCVVSNEILGPYNSYTETTRASRQVAGEPSSIARFHKAIIRPLRERLVC
jgi:hypothetical protein